MTLTAEEMLNNLRTFFRDATIPECEKLWDVLTALRGPDYVGGDESQIKSATTSVIREKVFTERSRVHEFAIILKDEEDYILVRKTLPHHDDHFVHHARRAFRALGMRWDELNKDQDDPVLTFKEDK